MEVDYLIVGQGISGTMLSWFLERAGKSFRVLDNAREPAASKVAAGIINPVTGRHYTYSWKIEEIMPFSVGIYEEMGRFFEKTYVHRKSVVDFFPSPQTRLAFLDRMARNDTYLHAFPDQNHYNQYFNYEFGCGEIRPAYVVHLQVLLADWRAHLKKQGRLLEEDFEPEELKLEDDGLRYGSISARKLVFCEGVRATDNPWFRMLPFAPSKGEALVIETEALTNEHVFKRGMLLAPVASPNQYWVGSNYIWDFADEESTENFRLQTTALLDRWLKGGYRVVDHKAAVRPATIERRPFVGLHPLYPQLAICNGMGTKGTSLAPYFAKELVDHLVSNQPLTPEADVRRFSRILSK